MNGSNDPWPPELVGRLRELITKQQMTSGEAAVVLGISRSAVIGKCQRLGLRLANGRHREPRYIDATERKRAWRERHNAVAEAVAARTEPAVPSQVQLVPNRDALGSSGVEPRSVSVAVVTRAAPVAAAPEPIQVPIAKPAPIPARPVAFYLSRANQCRFIAGQPAHDALVCGAVVVPGKSYCAEHHARCHSGQWLPKLKPVFQRSAPA